uniref:Uncharacterized protein n=1 Tax=Corethron hystrix TaxID=216773 RepID=A0A7S1FX55_9STRA|mmetsp:Transcript_34690/g.80221  ORF Transcript_34690/g.80221 Transcript_34690/m.80221 type:complete len:417 (+) Transcript_34690:65-1315(+)
MPSAIPPTTSILTSTIITVVCTAIGLVARSYFNLSLPLSFFAYLVGRWMFGTCIQKMTYQATQPQPQHFRNASLSGGNKRKALDGLNNETEDGTVDARFSYFVELTDDMKVAILSYVSEAPYEHCSDFHVCRRGTLTQVLPFVSREFRSFCLQSNILWKNSLHRALNADPDLWEEGLLQIINTYGVSNDKILSPPSDNGDGVVDLSRHEKNIAAVVDNETEASLSPKITDDDDPYAADLIRRACAAIKRKYANNNNGLPASHYDETNVLPLVGLTFQHVVMHHIHFSGQVFYMPGRVNLGEQFGLFFFEPRYRLLIREVMAGQPEQNLRGHPLDVDSRRNFPEFIYVNQAPLRRGTMGVVVQVRRCRINYDGTADVMLNPSRHVWVERVWERPGTGGLCHATVIRMGNAATDRFNT